MCAFALRNGEVASCVAEGMGICGTQFFWLNLYAWWNVQLYSVPGIGTVLTMQLNCFHALYMTVHEEGTKLC
jgi:hypothetical protein